MPFDSDSRNRFQLIFKAACQRLKGHFKRAVKVHKLLKFVRTINVYVIKLIDLLISLSKKLVKSLNDSST